MKEHDSNRPSFVPDNWDHIMFGAFAIALGLVAVFTNPHEVERVSAQMNAPNNSVQVAKQ